MKHWINKNYKTLIIFAFLIPILTVAIVSISHVTQWYGISNPVTWSIYLSIGIEIAALSALAAISANMGKKVYFPFAIVTLVQFIGNIFFAYSYIDINSKSFKDWVDLVSPFVEFIGIDPTDFIGHKRFLAFFAGGMLPVISLSFLHMLVKFTEEDRKKEEKRDESQDPNKLREFVDENVRLRLSENDLKKLEEVLLNPPPPNEALKNAAEKYKQEVEDKPWKGISQEVWDRMKKIEEQREALHGPILPEDVPTGALANSEYRERDITPALSDEEVREMFMDEWDRKFDMVEDEDFSTINPSEEEESENFSTITSNSENIFQENEMVEKLTEHQTETFSEEPEFIIPKQEPTIEEEAWTEKMEEQFWSEQVPEPFATPEEVEKFNIDIVPIEETPKTINDTLDSVNQIIDDEKKN